MWTATGWPAGDVDRDRMATAADILACYKHLDGGEPYLPRPSRCDRTEPVRTDL
jgi:hypothetical protein